jgi:hypothetical protein
VYSWISEHLQAVKIVFTEMEFLDINLTKNSSLLLHAIHSPFYWRILKKTILFFGFKNTKKIRETRKLEYIHEKHFVEQKNEGRKPDSSLCPETSTRNAVQEYDLSKWQYV